MDSCSVPPRTGHPALGAASCALSLTQHRGVVASGDQFLPESCVLAALSPRTQPWLCSSSRTCRPLPPEGLPASEPPTTIWVSQWHPQDGLAIVRPFRIVARRGPRALTDPSLHPSCTWSRCCIWSSLGRLSGPRFASVSGKHLRGLMRSLPGRMGRMTLWRLRQRLFEEMSLCAGQSCRHGGSVGAPGWGERPSEVGNQ